MLETTIIVKIHISADRRRLSNMNQYIHNLAVFTRNHNRHSTKRGIHNRSPPMPSSWVARRFRAAIICHLWPIHRFQVVHLRIILRTNCPTVSKWASNQIKIRKIKWFQFEVQQGHQIIRKDRRFHLPTILNSSILKNKTIMNNTQMEIWLKRQVKSKEKATLI